MRSKLSSAVYERCEVCIPWSAEAADSARRSVQLQSGAAVRSQQEVCRGGFLSRYSQTYAA